jgi:Copper transport outer membrane protein, MctB
MFDLRYHVASLAAVFFALVIGILVGVALASHGLGNAERRNLQDDLARAQRTIDQLNGAVQEDKADTKFVSSAYEAVMASRLQRERVAVLFVGPVDNGVRSAIATTLNDAGATMIRLRAISVPINGHSVESALAKRTALASYAFGAARWQNIGRELADEFVAGGSTALWDALEPELVEEKSGAWRRPADAVVVVRTVEPQTEHATSRIIASIFRELGLRSIPVVGVEFRGTYPSAVLTYKHFGISSVDDLDLPIGRVALAVLLSPNGITAHYGLQRNVDDAILPQTIAPVTTSTSGG